MGNGQEEMMTLATPEELEELQVQHNEPASPIIGRMPETEEDRVEQQRQTHANVIRYGVPAALGFAFPSLSVANIAAQSLATGGSEYLARRYENAEADPELESHWSDIKGGASIALIDQIGRAHV